MVSDVLLSRLEKDKLLFQCKRHTIFDMPFRNDGTLDASGRNSNVGGSESNDLVPPTKFHYYLISEGYLGYKFRDAMGRDNNESSAIMGGAVMAALTAWGDEKIKELFFQSGVMRYMSSDMEVDADTIVLYAELRRRLVGILNDAFIFALTRQKFDAKMDADVRKHGGIANYFCNHAHSCYPYRDDPSPFAQGDVDIFIQPDMLVSQYTKHFVEKLDADLFKVILMFIGPNPGGVLGTNCTSCHMNCYFRSLVNNELSDAYIYASVIPKGYDYQADFAENFVTISSRACTNEFVSAVEEVGDDTGNSRIGDGRGSCRPIQLWPRTTQAIQLVEGTTLQLGLMDFDIAGAAAADNGTEVFATHRCLYALLGGTAIVTPPVYGERRCQARMEKYNKRGLQSVQFDAYDYQKSLAVGKRDGNKELDKESFQDTIRSENDTTQTANPCVSQWYESRFIPVQLKNPIWVQNQDSIKGDIESDLCFGTQLLELKSKPLPNINETRKWSVQNITEVTRYNEDIHNFQNNREVVWTCGHNHGQDFHRYSLCLMPGEMTSKLQFVKSVVGDNWTPDLEELVQITDHRLLVVCTPIKIKIYTNECLGAMAAESFIIDNNNDYIEDTDDFLRNELVSSGWICRKANGENQRCSANGMHNDFYSGYHNSGALPRTGYPPKKVASQLTSKNNMEEHIHMRQCVSKGINWSSFFAFKYVIVFFASPTPGKITLSAVLISSILLVRVAVTPNLCKEKSTDCTFPAL